MRTQLTYIFLLMISALPISAQQKPLFLNELAITLDREIDFPKETFQRQYQTRVWSIDLQREIKTGILDQIRSKGYYFAVLDSSNIQIDSTQQSVSASLYYTVGKRVTLQGTSLGESSIPQSLYDRIDENLTGYKGKIYTPALANQLFADVLTKLENNGFPLAKVNTDNFQVSEKDNNILLDLKLQIEPGDSVKLAYLKFPKRPQDISPYLKRLLGFKNGQLYSHQKIANYRRILRRQEFIKTVEEPVLAQDKDGNYFLQINFEESPSTTLDGVVGYIPPPSTDPDASGYFTGLLNVGVRNLFGGGRKFRIFWEKEDELSDAFEVNYREPYLLSLPLHATLGLQRLVRDTTYIEWQYQLDLEVPINETLSGFVNVSTRSVAPDSLASRQLRLPITESVITGSGIRWDTRNERLNPRSGVNLEVGFSLSRQENTGPAYLLAEDSLRKSVTLRRVRADIHTFLPTFKRQVFSNRLHLQFIESTGAELQLADQFWFGGATTLRGFRESQFSAKRAFWVNSEYRFLLGPQARFFVFTDNGYYSRNSPDKREDWLSSYGIGLRFGAPLGIVQVDFGLERGTPFREGKLHFRLINEF